MENIDKEKNIGEIKKRDVLFPASIVIAALLLSFAWVYTAGLNAQEKGGRGGIQQGISTETLQGQPSSRRSAGCGV